MKGIVVALRSELWGIGGLDDPKSLDPQLDFIVTGMGQENVKKKLSEANFKEFDFIISAGFAGGLRPNFKSGNLCKVEKVSLFGSEQDGPIDLMTNFSKLYSELGVTGLPCGLVTAKDPIHDPEEKKRLFQSTGADIIDMETYWIAKYAVKNDIPMVGIRAIFDKVEDRLLPDRCYSSQSAQIRPFATLKWLGKNPLNVFELLKMGINSIKARKALSKELRSILTHEEVQAR